MRGIVYQTTGDLDHAIEQFVQAIQLSPKNAVVFRNRARSQFYLNHISSAVNDLITAVTIDPQNHYGVIWLHIVRWRGGQNDFDEIASNAQRLDKTKWPWPVVGLFLNAQTPAAMRAAANEADHPNELRYNLCDADFYLGIYQQMRGAEHEARQLFAAAAQECPVDTAERDAAQFELQRSPTVSEGTVILQLK